MSKTSKKSRFRPASRRFKGKKPSGKRSKFEEKVETLLQDKKIIAAYEKDVLQYTLNLSYKPDWSLGDNAYLEAKGRFDYIERRKILAVKKDNPRSTIAIIFMRDQKISKNSMTTYTDWCKKHGIPCSVYPELPL